MARFNVGEAFLQVTASVAGIHEKIAAEVAKIQDIEIDVNPNMAGFREKVAAGLAGIRDIEIDVTPNLQGFREKVAAETANLNDVTVNVRADADTGAAEAKIAALGSRSPTVHVNVDVDSARANIHTLDTALTGLVTKFGNANLGSTMFAGFGAAILPAIASIGQLSGALGLVPAWALGAGTALGALVVGSQGVGAALKGAAAAEEAAAAGGTKAKAAADAYAASLTNLAPSARSFVSAIVQLKPAFESLRLDVQQHLFQGIGDALLQLGNTVLPVVRTGLTQMADGLSEAARNVVAFASSKQALADYKTIFDNIGSAAHQLAGAVQPILQIFTDVAKVGSEFLPGLAAHFADAARSAAEFVRNARDSGKLREWIQAGIDAVRELWGVVKDVVAIFVDLATSPGFGPNFLEALHAVTTAIRWFIENVPGATTLVKLFFDAWLFAKVVQGLMGMASTIGTVVTALKKVVIANEAAAVSSEKAAARSGKAWKLAALAVGAFAVGEGLKAAGKPAEQPFGDLSTMDKFRDAADTAGKLLTLDFGGVFDKFKRDLDNLPNDLQTAGSRVQPLVQIFKDAGTAADDFGDAVIRALDSVISKAGEWIGRAWDATIGAKDNATQIIQGVINKAAEWIGRAWEAAVNAKDNATQIIQGVINKAAEWIGRAWEAAVNAKDNAVSVIQGVINKAAEWIGRAWEAAVNAKDNAVSVIQGVINKAAEWIGRAWEAAINARDNAVRVIQGVINKAAEWIGRAWEAGVNARDNASSVIRGIWDNLMRLVSQVWTVVVKTVTGGAGGMIYTPMAAGGVLPMASGGFTPMSASTARIVPPNTFRLIGDRASGDEAFIPINRSAGSVALLGMTASRMGFGLMPMRRGGYHRHSRDGWVWEWLEELLRRRRGHPGGGGSGSGEVPPPTDSGPVPQPTTIGTSSLQRMASSVAFGGPGGTASYARNVLTPATQILSNPVPAVPTPPSGGSGGGRNEPIILKFDAGASRYGSFLIEELRRVVRVQGGDVQVVLGQ